VREGDGTMTGFLGTFIALFYAGLQGEPRWSANIALPYAVPNLIASLFAILIAASVFTLVYNVVITLARGERATADEWGAKTLEWTVPTPVPLENFEHLPEVKASPYTYGLPEPEIVGPSVVTSKSHEDSLPATATAVDTSQQSPSES
jgi:cytochrome c oxidase subunit I